MHVGGSCPPEKVPLLLKMLDPSVDGSLLVPVDSALKLLRRHACGAVDTTTVSSVSFSELEAPPDAAIVLETVADEIRRKCQVWWVGRVHDVKAANPKAFRMSSPLPHRRVY